MIQVPAPPVPPTPEAIFVGGSGGGAFDSPAFVITAIAALAAVTLILWPLVRAMARRLEGRGTPDAATQHELEELRARVHELEAGQARMAELEERLDCTERILTQKQEPARLPEGR